MIRIMPKRLNWHDPILKHTLKDPLVGLSLLAAIRVGVLKDYLSTSSWPRALRISPVVD
jgi:hypothetical protein